MNDGTSLTRPTVMLSYAQTLDGRLATATGDSRWISCPETLRYSHLLRARHDAVMVGIGTVIADDPQLTVRLVEGPNPLRVVVDSELRTPAFAKVLSQCRDYGTLIAVTARASRSRREEVVALGATVVILPEDENGRVDLVALMHSLRQRGVRSLIVEGGSALITEVIRRRLADRISICIAPRLIGSGVDAIGDLGVSALSDAITIDHVTTRPMGRDIVVEGQLVYPEAIPAQDLRANGQ